MAATPEEKYELITRGLQEVLGGESIKAILAEGRHPKCYWGAYSQNLRSNPFLKILFFFKKTYRNCSNRKTYVNRLIKQHKIVASNFKYYRCSSSHRLLCCIDQNRGFPSRRCSCKFLTHKYFHCGHQLCFGIIRLRSYLQVN